jgi:hypothetical protein
MKRVLAQLAVIAIASAAVAQAPAVYPAKGQSPEQIEKDKGECHMWAVKESGFDPASRVAPPQTISVAVQPQPVTGSGARVRGAARGAAAGAVVGEVADNDPGKGAAAGAAGGAMVAGSRQRRANRAAAEAGSTQPNPEYDKYVQDKSRYDGAVNACLTGRGYTLS